MGDVWHADDLLLQTPVALKLIWSAGPAARAGILQEVRAVFFSMELVHGVDLAALLRRVGRLPPERVAEIARDLCTGLAAAHAQGVLHCDLKPANVLIDRDGRVRITDFGIAITSGEAARSALIATTPYMAPEQLASGTPLSDRTDLYALGVMLYELLTGQRPMLAPSGSVSHATRSSLLASGVNPKLARVVLRAISPDPRHRPSSALVMAAELPDIDRAEGIEAPVVFPQSRCWWTPSWRAAAGVVRHRLERAGKTREVALIDAAARRVA